MVYPRVVVELSQWLQKICCLSACAFSSNGAITCWSLHWIKWWGLSFSWLPDFEVQLDSEQQASMLWHCCLVVRKFSICSTFCKDFLTWCFVCCGKCTLCLINLFTHQQCIYWVMQVCIKCSDLSEDVPYWLCREATKNHATDWWRSHTYSTCQCLGQSCSGKRCAHVLPQKLQSWQFYHMNL